MSNKIKDLNTKILYFLVFFMEISDIWDIEKVMRKAAPYLSIFILGYALTIERTTFLIVSFIISIILGAYFIFLKEDSDLRSMTKLLRKDKDSKTIAKEIGKKPFIPFFIKGISIFLMFVLKVISLIVAINYAIKDFTIIWAILIILASISVIYTLLVVIREKKLIKEVTLLIKGRKPN